MILHGYSDHLHVWREKGRPGNTKGLMSGTPRFRGRARPQTHVTGAKPLASDGLPGEHQLSLLVEFL